MSDMKKAKWLQIHYKSYSLSWYLADSKRLNGIFQKEYSRFMSEQNRRIVEGEQKELKWLQDKMCLAYKSYYGSDYSSDSRLNRRETFEKVQAIRHLWSY